MVLNEVAEFSENPELKGVASEFGQAGQSGCV
jgi:hypothetical protein